MRKLVVYVDGSCLNNQGETKVAACRIVVEDSNTTIEDKKFDLGNVSNNIAELVAIEKGLEYIVNSKCRSAEILTDSKVALAWLSKGPSKDLPEEKKAEVTAILDRIRKLSKQCKEDSVSVVRIPGEEQRADFGFKNKKRKKA